jgi:hypothetical protein
MAIVSINEHWNGRGASTEAKEGKVDFERTYIVVVDSPDDGPQTILLDSRIPQDYAIYETLTETNLKCRVIDRKCTQEGEGYFVWMVSVTYSSKWYDQAKNDPNPLLRPEIISWNTEDHQEVFQEDLDGNPVINASNEPFDPPVMRQTSRLTINVEKNVQSVDPFQIASFLYTVNADFFKSYEPGLVMLVSANWTATYEGEFVYDKLRLTFKVNINGWENMRILNQGYMELAADLTNFRVILDGSGNPVSRPRLLDTNGVQLASGADPEFLTFRAYERKDFTLLGIGN